MKELKQIMNLQKRKSFYAAETLSVLFWVPIPSRESQSRFFGRRQHFTVRTYTKGVGSMIWLNGIQTNLVKFLLVIALLFFISPALHAQKPDSLSLLRNFVNISTGYKQMPLYLSLEMKNSTNFITGEEDTTTVQGEFFLRNENSYVKFGEFEQLVNDSLALLVSDKLQQMILYTNAGPVVKQMKNMMGAALPDSSVRNLAARYSSSSAELTKKTNSIYLQSRALVYGTSLPRESIELQYDVKKKEPQQVITMKRSLLRLDSLQYVQLSTDEVLAAKLLTLEGNYFLIKEQFTAYNYKKIEQAATTKVPVLISDRIVRNKEGEYEPVKKYELYRLTMND